MSQDLEINTITAAGNYLGSAPTYNDSANATNIQRVGPLTVVLVNGGSSASTVGVNLPTDMLPGDEIEVYLISGSGSIVYFPAGDTLNGVSYSVAPPASSANYITSAGSGPGLHVRKVSATDWRYV